MKCSEQIKARNATENANILRRRMDALDMQPGPRVGDYLKLNPPNPRCPGWTRFTHDWGESLQTGGSSGGAYYLGDGFLSYSGSLDSGLSVLDIIPTDETKLGRVWFFDRDMSGAGRGVYFDVLMRVFVPRPGANLDGIEELQSPYHLSVLSEEQRKTTCGYWFTVTHDPMAHRAFATEIQLREWLAVEHLALTCNDLSRPSHQRLAFA